MKEKICFMLAILVCLLTSGCAAENDYTESTTRPASQTDTGAVTNEAIENDASEKSPTTNAETQKPQEPAIYNQPPVGQNQPGGGVKMADLQHVTVLPFEVTADNTMVFGDAFVFESGRGSQIKLTLLSAERHDELDENLYPAKRFSQDDYAKFVSAGKVKDDVAFITIEVTAEALKIIEEDILYMDAFQLNNIADDPTIHTIISNRYMNSSDHEVIGFSDKPKDFSIIKMKEGSSGTLTLGFFVPVIRLDNAEMYLVMSTRPFDAYNTERFYMSMKDLLGNQP